MVTQIHLKRQQNNTTLINKDQLTFDRLISLTKPIVIDGHEPEIIGKLTQDSRNVQKGSVFMAVKGTNVDGHDFIKEAAQRGASVVICEELNFTPQNVSVLKVDETRPLVGLLAQAFEGYPANKLTVIGITGTNGKTTTATLIYQVLQKLGVKTSLLGTVTKRIGGEKLPSRLTTADPIEIARDMRQMVDAGSTHLVMEISSHALKQKRVEDINFDIAAFTNLSHDHLDYHADMNEYAEAKKLLFDGLDAAAYAVINGDDAHSANMAKDCDAHIISFGFKNDKGISCTISKSSSQGLTLTVDGTQIESPLIGNFNAYNVAQTFLICRALGYKDPKITDALSTATGAPGRLEQVKIENLPKQPLVLVDYAHTPAALKNVLQSLVALKQEDQTLHVIFGCGGDRDKTKRPKMAGAVEKFADRITITSDNPRNEEPGAIINDAMRGFSNSDKVTCNTDRRKAIHRAIAEADDRSIILIAGKGHETYQEVKGVRHHFDDREIALEALRDPNGNPKSKEVR